MDVIDALITDVHPDPAQPRKQFKPGELEDLAASIRENGIIQPLTVQERAEGGYTIVAGERRWRAAGIAGLSLVPVIVRSFEEAQLRIIQILENVARADLNPMEEGEAFHALILLGLSPERVAPQVGKSVAYVTARLSLLGLDTSLQALVRSGQMNTTTGYQLAKLTGEKQHIAAKAWLDKGLSTGALTKLVDRLAVDQDAMFTEDEAPKRQAEATVARDRIMSAIDRAIDAVTSALDKRTLELLPEALRGDVQMTVQRLALLEKAVINLRAEVEASAARATPGLLDGV